MDTWAFKINILINITKVNIHFRLISIGIMSDLKINYIQENINSRFKMPDRDLWWDEHWFIINKDKICFDIFLYLISRHSGDLQEEFRWCYLHEIGVFLRSSQVRISFHFQLRPKEKKLKFYGATKYIFIKLVARFFERIPLTV